jgi:hypothetical protein
VAQQLYDPIQLSDRFGEIAAQARASAVGDAAGARLRLEHMRFMPFDKTVGERVLCITIGGVGE